MSAVRNEIVALSEHHTRHEQGVSHRSSRSTLDPISQHPAASGDSSLTSQPITIVSKQHHHHHHLPLWEILGCFFFVLSTIGARW
jgi:hypothetical protein